MYNYNSIYGIICISNILGVFFTDPYNIPMQSNVTDLPVESPDINHSLAIDLLRITKLVYSYGNELKLNRPDETVENLKLSNAFDKLAISDTLKRVLLDVSENVPSGKLCKFISNTESDIQVGITVCEENKRICVVFRGSESTTDWMYNLKIVKHHIRDGISVHSGFYNQLCDNNIYSEIVDTVKHLLDEYSGFQIFVTGHSLGSALGTLFCYMLSFEIPNDVVVVSFASPRVGNYKWKESFESKSNLKHYRITNKRDVITAVPYYKYYHVGHHICLSDDSFSQNSTRNWYDETVLTCWSVYEHACDVYYSRLTKHKW